MNTTVGVHREVDMLGRARFKCCLSELISQNCVAKKKPIFTDGVTLEQNGDDFFTGEDQSQLDSWVSRTLQREM